MTIVSGVRRPLRRAAMAFAIATVAVAAFSPMSAQALSDEADHLDSAGVALLDDAIDALSEGDDERYEILLEQAFDGSVWLPLPTVIALDDREVEDIVAWSQVLDGATEDVLDAAFDVIQNERDALAVLDGFAPDQETTPEQSTDIDDADLDGTGLLDLIDRRGIEIPDSARLVLGPLSVSGEAIPATTDYEAALVDLDAQETPVMGGREPEPAFEPTTTPIADAAEPTPPAATLSDSSDSSPLPMIVAIALGASALALGLFGAFRTRKTDQLADIAFTDGLTGLNNRRRLDADIATQRSKSGRTVASLMVDIDNFKTFNDTHGHAMGDEVLRMVGETLGREFRKTDVPYRYGGEEFCILLNDATPTEAHAAGERARVAIEAIQLPISERVTASIGVSIGAASEVSDTIGRADGALYEAKRAGRNCVATA